MRVLISIIAVTLLLVCPSYAGISFSPQVGIGWETNDNLDLAPSGAVYSNSFIGQTGAAIESYLNPDLFSYLNITYRGNSYSDVSYGKTAVSAADIGLAYDLSERLAVEIEAIGEGYNDSLIEDNNYQGGTFIPELNFKLTPYTLLGARWAHTALNYINSAEGSYIHKNGGYLSQQLADWCTLTIGGYAVNGEQTQSSLNYTGTETQAGLFFSFAPDLEANIAYIYEELKYEDWSPTRNDIKRSTVITLRKYFNESWSILFGCSTAVNDSKDKTQGYTNTIATLYLSYQPVFGNIYEDDIDNESDYFYSEALKAYDREDWGTAEKQFRKLVFVEENNAENQFYLGYCLHRQGKYWEGAEHFQKVLALDPGHTGAYRLLAYAYIQMDRKAEAIRTLRELLKISDDTEARRTLEQLEKE